MSEQNLAQRLGHGPEDRLLIISCDDLGSSHACNLGALRGVTYGVATSATLMVPCSWAREAATLFAGRAVGVHLTVTSELQGYRWRGLTIGPSLYDDEGFLTATRQEAMQRIDPEEARAECRAQIETALKWGVDVTHLDTHMYVMQGREDLYDVYLDLALEFRLPVRMASKAVAARFGFDAHGKADARGVLYNEYIVNCWPRHTGEVFKEEAPKLQPGVTEIYAHPVLDGDELRAFDPLHADIRAADAAFLCDPAAAALLNALGVKRISFREIRNLQRKAA